jgi:hypothetical protein
MMYIYRKRRIDKNLSKLIYYNCTLFNPKTMDKDKYFLNKDPTNVQVDEKREEVDPQSDRNTIITNNYIHTDKGVTIYEGVIPKTNIGRVVSLRDYESLEDGDMLLYDKRTIVTLIKDNLVSKHILLSLIFKSSLQEPLFIRFFDLIFTLSIQAGTNALLFSDKYIDSRNHSPTNVNHC